MEIEKADDLLTQSGELQSRHLKRTVKLDFYKTDPEASNCSLLLVNDGQDLVTMDFSKILQKLNLRPLIVAGIHCGADRKNEYGMITGPDYKGWGAKASSYEKFIIKELLPFIINQFPGINFTEKGFAGFSLGGLSALDISWHHPEIFSMTAVFSGSLWWRSVDKDDKDYDPWKHRMMHKQIAESDMRPGMTFFFECGEMDEMEDRNKNGVIDSIDDTLDLMRILVRKGYREGKNLSYLQMPEGRHDVPSWAKALPHFLKWAYSADPSRSLP
ncbi:MAG: esterase [Chitinophagaceae bacterium]|nr:esterase [Chitinophagaceae bacterium]